MDKLFVLFHWYKRMGRPSRMKEEGKSMSATRQRPETTRTSAALSLIINGARMIALGPVGRLTALNQSGVPVPNPGLPSLRQIAGDLRMADPARDATGACAKAARVTGTNLEPALRPVDLGWDPLAP
jgi:hypothetical protein